MLGRRRAVCIVWVRNLADIEAPQPNYRPLPWGNPPSNGVGLAELNAYDICGLSVIISRTVPHNPIGYILGATGEGRKELCLHPGFLVSNINYVFIENDEDVRAWLRSNPVLEDPLDPLVYCYGQYTVDRVSAPPLRRHNYLPANAITNWARQAGARTSIQAPQKELRPDPGPANAGGNQANHSPLCLPVSSSSSSDVSDACKGCQAIIGTSQAPVADPTQSAQSRIPLAIQFSSKMHTHHRGDLRGSEGETSDVKVWKRGALYDLEDWEHLN